MREPIARFIRQKRAPHGVDAPLGQGVGVAATVSPGLLQPYRVVFITIRDDYSNQTRQYPATAEVRVAELLDVMTHAVG
jgi:hypothetical protein